MSRLLKNLSKKCGMIRLMVWNMSPLHHSVNSYYNEAKFDRELDHNHVKVVRTVLLF